MAHPRTYSEDDPYLEDIRRICLALPESSEVEAWGRPTFRAGKKMFAVFIRHDEAERFALVFKPDPDERHALMHDKRFFPPKYWGPSGWLALDLDAAKVDWEEVAELVDASYRTVALKRMLKVLDS